MSINLEFLLLWSWQQTSKISYQAIYSFLILVSSCLACQAKFHWSQCMAKVANYTDIFSHQ